MIPKKLIVALLLAGMGGADQAHAQSCLSSSSPVAIPTVTPNRKPVRLAAAGTEIGAILQEYGSNALYFTRYTLLLAPTGDQVELIRPATPLTPVAFLYAGNEYGFFFNEAADTRLRLMRISSEGAIISGPIYVLNESRTATRESYDVLWDGATYLIARTDLSKTAQGVWLDRVTKEGVVISSERVSVTVSSDSVVFLELVDGLPVLFWNAAPSPRSGQVTFAAYLDASDFVRHFREVPITGKIAGIAVEGQRVLLVSAGINNRENRITWIILNEEGMALAPEADLVTAPGSDLLSVQSVLSGGGEFAVAYRRILSSGVVLEEYRLRRMTLDMELISDLPFSPDSVRQFYIPDGDPVRTNNAYIHSVTRTTTSGYDTILISRCPYQARLSSTHLSARTLEPVRFSVEISGGVPPFNVRWDFGDRFFGTGNPATHSYLTPGRYEVKVTITDATGAEIQLQGTVDVENAPTRRRGARY